MSPTWRTAVNLWDSTQVELHGFYSEARVLELAQYSAETSWLRVIAVLFITPLPCLLVTVAVDLLPLADPSEELGANKMFFVRVFYTFVVVSVLVVQQFRMSVPILPYPLRRVLVESMLISACIVGIFYGVAQTVGFPVPFGLLMMAPLWATLILITMAIAWAKKVRETPGAATMITNAAKLWMCQVMLTFTYPPYFFIFTTLPKSGKTAFALLLPLIKLFMRNVVARTVTHLKDEIPEVVVFNCDVFNALFVSYCMQNSPSIWITLEIMFFDVVVMTFSLRGARSSRRYLRDLELRMEQQHELDGIKSFRGLPGQATTTLQRATLLLSGNSKPQATIVSRAANPTRIAPSPVLVNGAAGSQIMTKLFVVRPKAVKSASAPARFFSLEAQRAPTLHIVDENPRLQSRYIRKVQRLLYAAEFLLLLNYVEVIIPLVFSIYLICMFYLPNGNYYAQIHGMNRTELVETLKSVQFYCALQIASLLLLFMALRQILGLSPVHQLAFVLEKQFAGVQNKMMFWVFYNVQASLQHNALTVDERDDNLHVIEQQEEFSGIHQLLDLASVSNRRVLVDICCRMDANLAE